MGYDWRTLLVFAQQEVGEAAGDAAGQRGPGLGDFLVPIAMMGVVFYFLFIVPERKKTKKKQDMLEALKKNDKVVTIGGLYGVVANVKTGEDEVMLKIDEDKDVKVKVTRSSIAHILTVAKEE